MSLKFRDEFVDGRRVGSVRSEGGNFILVGNVYCAHESYSTHR